MNKKMTHEQRMAVDPSYRAKVNEPACAIMNDVDDSDLPFEQRRYPPGVKNTKSTDMGIPRFNLLVPAKQVKIKRKIR